MQPSLSLLDSSRGASRGGFWFAVLARSITREQLFAGLALVGFANGTIIRILLDLASQDWWMAVANTFGISVLIWAALWLCTRLLLQAPQTEITSRDATVATLVVLLALVPVAAISWLALTGLALYIASTSPRGSAQSRGAWILLALTVPMFWSREIFTILSEYILELEALLVGAAMNSPTVGNMVQFADGTGYMQIYPACSSFANVSLAVLCWVTFSQVTRYEGSRSQAVGWCLLACASVLLINVTRISLIGFFPHYYDLLHGPIGTSVAGWLTLAASVAICAIGVKRGPIQRTATPEPAHA